MQESMPCACVVKDWCVCFCARIDFFQKRRRKKLLESALGSKTRDGGGGDSPGHVTPSRVWMSFYEVHELLLFVLLIFIVRSCKGPEGKITNHLNLPPAQRPQCCALCGH